MKKKFLGFLFSSLVLSGCSPTEAPPTNSRVSTKVCAPQSVPSQYLGKVPAVVVLPPQVDNGCLGSVLLPDGTQMNITSSRTSGIQEAIDYASDYGWDLFILSGPNNVYHLDSGLKFPAIQGKTIRTGKVVLNFSKLVTGAAIHFDSTMMVDIKMLGELKAPQAKYGVLIRPKALFPLDGFFLGHGGSVDSRFRFEKITTKQYGAYFDNHDGNLVDSVYYFGDSEIGNVEVAYNSKVETSAEAPMDEMFYDLLNPIHEVVVHPPEGPIGSLSKVFLPDGSELSVTGSTSAGIQEAIDYAELHSLNLVVYGRGLQNKYIESVNSYATNGFYQINSGLKFTPGLKNVMMYNVTLNYSPLTVPAISVENSEDSKFELTGQIVAPDTPVGFYIKDSSNSVFRLGHILGGASNVVLEGDILNSRIMIHELLRSSAGVTILNPESFVDSSVDVIHLHIGE